jgi:hypothetical protein
MKQRMLFLTALLLGIGMAAPVLAQSGGIKGSVRSAEGELLPFASIYIRELATGNSSNPDGYFEIRLPAGTYQFIFQYLGYETLVQQVEVDQSMKEISVTLKPQVYVLQEQEIRSKREDPAYAIVRKAIAKSRYHLMQLDAYQTMVYIKGSGQLLKIPFLFKKMAEKEGIDTKTVYMTESVSEISFKRPNTYEEKVLSLQTTMPEEASPNAYIKSSFYDPEPVGLISPLHPKAFSYYRFEYLGSYRDREYEINRIKVIPRTRGTNLFEGEMNIVEDLWCFHSLHLTTIVQGITIKISKVYAPIEQVAWLPVTQTFKVWGSFLGAEGEFKYVATNSDYQITLNPDLIAEVKVLDEKTEKQQLRALRQEAAAPAPEEQGLFNSQETLSRKEMRKRLEAYEKEMAKNAPEPEVLYQTKVTVDSLANKRTAEYWDQIRPIPLAELEKVSYQKRDSLVQVEKQKVEKDSLKAEKNKKFRPEHVVFGNTYTLAKNHRLQWENVLTAVDFNTVEGWNISPGLVYRYQKKDKGTLEIGSKARYAFAREQWSGKGNISYQAPKNKYQLSLEGGRYISQLNANNPIMYKINTAYSLLFEENWMKIYEKDYVRAEFKQRIGEGFRLKVSAEYAQRLALANQVERGWVNRRSIAFTSNDPPNLEIGAGTFPQHEALLAQVDLQFQPGIKYVMRNGNKYRRETRNDLYGFTYRKGMLDSRFDHLELHWKNQVKLGFFGHLDYVVNAGSFLNNNQVFFPDFRHIQGNRIVFQTSDILTSFRLADYYLFSTQASYLESFVMVTPRKLLLTRIPYVRMAGIQERVFVNYFGTTGTARPYTETGFVIDNLFRVFRLEAVTSFLGSSYADFGFRIGFTGNFSFN